jgi:hypothetical protein
MRRAWRPAFRVPRRAVFESGGVRDRALRGEPELIGGRCHCYRLDDDATYCSLWYWSDGSAGARRRDRASRKVVETKRDASEVKVLPSLDVDLTVRTSERSPNASISSGAGQVNIQMYTGREPMCPIGRVAGLTQCEKRSVPASRTVAEARLFPPRKPRFLPFQLLTMGRGRRILAVTAGLIGFGAIAGAIAGALVAMLAIAIRRGPLEALDLDLAEIGATLGAPLGALLLPAAGWLLMRRVPLGRAMLGTMLGTVAGGLIGWLAPVHLFQVYRTLLFGFLGFVLSVVVLRRTASVASAQLAEPAGPVA